MQYLTRIGGMLAAVASVSGAIAIAFGWVASTYHLFAGISPISVFVGLATAGLFGAVLARDSWLMA